MTDDSYDSDFPFPHLDAPQQNDLIIRQVGVDKVIVERHKDYSSFTRSNGYPFDEEIDYIREADEDRSKHNE